MVATLRRISVLALPLFLVACEQQKSSNPLSPEVAGPMAGISISALPMLTPGTGAQITDASQPFALVVGNPNTNSPRTVTIDTQIAADSAFANVVFSQNDVPQGADGRTTIPLSAKLPNGRTYYWRAKAVDGANDSGWSAPVSFQVLQPIAIGVPTPKAPIGNVRVTNTTPDLDVANGVSAGPHGPLHYQFQVAEDQAFAATFIDAVVPEGTGDTHDTVTFLTASNHSYYWRVRILDEGGDIGNWSSTATFLSPVAPATIGPSGPSGGGGTNADVNSCNSLVGDPPSLVQCIHDIINPGPSGALAFEVTKRVAWALRGQGAGLLLKPGGDAIITWKGQSFSISRVCFPDGHIWKDITDAGDGGTNGAGWSDNGFVDPSLYVPAIDPSS
jgi:hypothetical protein